MTRKKFRLLSWLLSKRNYNGSGDRLSFKKDSKYNASTHFYAIAGCMEENNTARVYLRERYKIKNI